MKNIHQEIKIALALLEQIQIKDYSIDSVGISVADSKEYDQVAEDILKIAEKHVEDEHGILVKFKEPVADIKFARLVKPGEQKYVSVQTNNFEEAKKAYPNAKLIEGEGWKLLEVKLENGNIMISDIFESEFYFKPQKETETQPDELSKLKADLDLEKQKRISLMADFQNYQRRIENEKSNWGAMSNMSLIKDILEIHDDIELALQDENLSLEHAKSAMTSAQDKLVDSAKRNGIEKVEVKIGDVFDKEKMEAVSVVAVQDESQKGKVIAVISSAYKYSNKEHVLKAAKVVVGK